MEDKVPNNIKKSCDFCGRSRVGSLIESPVFKKEVNGRPKGTNFFICANCVSLANQMVKDNAATKQKNTKDLGSIPNPKKVVQHMNKYIVGQELAKKTLSVSVCNHYKRLFSNLDESDDVQIDKSNILLIGPTGSGKTLFARTLAKFLDVPFAIGDATTLTESGYVGEDVENLVLKLLHAADFDLSAAEKGIIYIDEIDKIGRTNNNVSITRDVSGEGVQQSLLKLIEGTICNVPPAGGRKHPEQEFIRIDTTNILFICGGTFSGLDDIIKKRIGKKSIGFGPNEELDKEFLSTQVKEDDLVNFGLIPELIGRLPCITPLNGFKEEDLIRILTEPKDSLVKQYKKIFSYDNVEIDFSLDALREIAKISLAKGTGARGLRGVMESLLLDLMYESSDNSGKKITITPEMVSGEEILCFKSKAA